MPGVLEGEGCSTAGGCATCPFMKMNSLDALLSLLEKLDGPAAALAPFAPRTYAETIDGHSIAALGTQTIVRMRDFQKRGSLSDELVRAIAAKPLDRSTAQR